MASKFNKLEHGKQNNLAVEIVFEGFKSNLTGTTAGEVILNNG